MRCSERTRNGHRCTRNAQRGQQVCASHAGKCGARPGNQNALKHGRYSERLRQLFPDLTAAEGQESLTTEIALTRELIVHILTPPLKRSKPADDAEAPQEADAEGPAMMEIPVESYTRLVDVLLKALKLDRTLRGEQANDLATKLAAALEAVGEELGIND
jgi:hypothetical protein